jgi:putative tryptophan/tyrosine transport system substrate-binding protein
MIFNPDTAPRSGTYYFSEFEAAARISKVEPIAARVRSDTEIETVVTSLGRGPDNGLVVMPDYFMLNHSQSVISLAAQSNVPAYPWKFVVTRDGALISYGPDFRDIVRRAAPYVDRILRGAIPAELPVQVPTKFEMAVNVKTAKALGLKVPPSVPTRSSNNAGFFRSWHEPDLPRCPRFGRYGASSSWLFPFLAMLPLAARRANG